MAELRVTLLDHGINNLRSIRNALLALGADVRIAREADELTDAGHLLLPGVGAFGSSMEQLRAHGLVAAIRDHVAAGRPFMGICLGFQVMFESSEEHGHHEGLGLFPGQVRRFMGDLPVPHVGWNEVQTHREHPIFSELGSPVHMYFVHSFHPVEVPTSVALASSEYGSPFVCAASAGSAVGTQFHPERSGADGLRILRNFLEWRP